MTAIAEKWLPSTRSGNPVTLMTTELNSLASTGTATSAAIDNDADHDMLMDLELLITYGTNPTANTVIEVSIVRTVDGTNYEQTPPLGGIVGAWTLKATTSAQRIIIPGVVVPPRDFKLYVEAKTTGQTAAASGNTVVGYFYGAQGL